MSARLDAPAAAMEFGRALAGARERARLSTRKLAQVTRLPRRRIEALERGDELPTEAEIAVLAQGCTLTVFELIPPGFSLSVLVHGESGPTEARGERALDALLREYLSMVVELRSGHAVTAPSLRQDDLVELAAALGDDREAIEARLIGLLGTDGTDAPAIRSLILPSTATG